MNAHGIVPACTTLVLCGVSLILGGLTGLASNPAGVQRQAPRVRSKTKTAKPPPTPSETTPLQLGEAAALLQSGKLDEAERILRRIILSTPTNADAHSLLGIILDQRGKFTEAEKEYREALRLNPNAISPLANLGVLLARTKRSAEAIKSFESVLLQSPHHPQATLNLGLQYFDLGDYLRAAPKLEQALNLGLGGYDVRHKLGVALFNLKRYNEATAVLESVSPPTAEIAYYLGLIYWARDQDETAVQHWERAVELREKFPEAHFMLGEALRKHGRTEASLKFYKRALDQDPASFVYYARLGGAHMLLLQYDQALDLFQRAAERFPDKPEAFYFVGIAARGQRSYDVAETAFRRALKIQPNNVDALAQLGFLVGERARFDEAEQLLRLAIKLGDQHFFAHYDLGRLLVKTLRYKEAVPILERGVKLKANNPDVHYQLFLAFSRLKQKELADREMALFKSLDDERKRREKEGDVEQDDYIQSWSPLHAPADTLTPKVP